VKLKILLVVALKVIIRRGLTKNAGFAAEKKLKKVAGKMLA
jgi:hypothetical protein